MGRQPPHAVPARQASPSSSEVRAPRLTACLMRSSDTPQQMQMTITYLHTVTIVLGQNAGLSEDLLGAFQVHEVLHGDAWLEDVG